MLRQVIRSGYMVFVSSKFRHGFVSVVVCRRHGNFDYITFVILELQLQDLRACKPPLLTPLENHILLFLIKKY